MSHDTSAVPPDLASVLATLAQFAPPEQTHGTIDNGIGTQAAPSQDSLDVPDDPRNVRYSSRSPLPNKDIIDPATITEWSAGLRCVSKIATQNPAIAEAIRTVRPYVSLRRY